MTGGVGQVADLELVDAGLGAVRDLVEPGLVLGLDGGQAALEGVYVLRLGGGKGGAGEGCLCAPAARKQRQRGDGRRDGGRDEKGREMEEARGEKGKGKSRMGRMEGERRWMKEEGSNGTGFSLSTA